ncbi:hypothetical protein SAMN05443572_106356 [Myxococcus fulvus]|uniref:Lipoprotein n=1 Tax=Myxococcus fulvus TaxID=33 RepID=A0A511T231_MYXFU|nr:hypothetical protein [Myxococcus fulvus]AKF86579.1 hypothetical protein MFUL124B02_29580 [Myxococcus fulvus 124B02]GEN08219.1 hypothetical protein MFU01_32560 [Myxococcus fulvus]SEU22032.1 hypothetical protein SAMN05443572_106356 [Myxococcus fulvus]
MKAAWGVVVALSLGLVVGCGVGTDATEDRPVADDALATSESALAVCGDGICEPIERLRCPADCRGEYCGNGACCPGETAQSCPGDCTQGDPGQFCYRGF